MGRRCNNKGEIVLCARNNAVTTFYSFGAIVSTEFLITSGAVGGEIFNLHLTFLILIFFRSRTSRFSGFFNF